MPERKVSISDGNSKMGHVVSVSLSPVSSCGKALPCFKSCYALKLARLRPCVKAAWENNWKMAMTDRDEYFRQILHAVEKKKPRLFRWHVAGDFPDADYVKRAVILAMAFRRVRWLAFTKKYELALRCSDTLDLAPNLTIVASAWPGLDMLEETLNAFPTAWMRDPKNPDPRIPARAKECHGDCEKCGACWNLVPGEAVYFPKH